MTTTARHPLVEDYLRRLWTEAAALPVDEARELLADIQEHVSAALGADASETQVRNVLERLGTPADLVASADGARATPEPKPKAFASPGAAIVCLIAAEILSILLPLSLPLWILGLVMMARTTAWSERDRTLGFVALGTGFPASVVLVFLSLTVVGGCSQVYENERLVSDTCGGTNWVAIVAWTLTLSYLAFQAFTVRRLLRSARRP